MRALGNLSRFVQFSSQSGVVEEPVDGVGLSLGIRQKEQSVLNSFQGAFSDDSRWLGRMVQAFLSCVATGNVKVFVCSFFIKQGFDLGGWHSHFYLIFLQLLSQLRMASTSRSNGMFVTH